MFRGVIFDFYRTLYDPGTGHVMPGARMLLSELRRRGVRMCLVSMGGGDRERELASTGLREFFVEVFIVPEKSVGVFERCLAALRLPRSEVAVVGDHPFKEIAIGNEMGLFTVWLCQGVVVRHFSASTVGASVTVSSLREVLPALVGSAAL